MKTTTEEQAKVVEDKITGHSTATGELFLERSKLAKIIVELFDRIEELENKLRQ